MTFDDSTQPSTTATFSAAGTYTLMLSADDGVHAVAYDALIVSVGMATPTPTPTPTPTATPKPGPTPLPVSLGNVSTRLQVGSGNSVLIGGFIIGGSGAKKVIVRALGPSLTARGVTNALGDPVLELHNSRGNLIFSNDNWKDTQEQWIRDSLIPPTNDRESAIVASLVPGPYTAIVRGKNNTTGVALIEVYDLQKTSGSRLVNISTRGFVSGNNVMIAGLIVLGSQPTKILFRGLGPSLSAAGITQALHDPRLDLFNSQGARMAENDDWKDSQQAAIAATGIPPTSNFESAIRVDLNPGNYTAIMSGMNGGTGIALIEAYNLP